MEIAKTKIKVNKVIHRMGFQARPLLIILSSMLILGTVIIGILGYVGWIFVSLLVYGFIKLSNYLKSEIELGNLNPLDDLLSNLNKPTSLYDDGIIDLLKERKK